MAELSSVKTFIGNYTRDEEWASRSGSGAYFRWTVEPATHATMVGEDTDMCTIIFSYSGTYTITFTVSDGAMAVRDDITYTITNPNIAGNDADNNNSGDGSGDGSSGGSGSGSGGSGDNTAGDGTGSDGGVVEPTIVSDLTLPFTFALPTGTTVFNDIDISFATDNSGSMSSLINNYKAAISSIVDSISTYGESVRCGFVGYRTKDHTDDTYYDLTSNKSTMSTAISKQSAGGGDEYGYYAVTMLAKDNSWKTGSIRLIIVASSDWDNTGDTGSYNTTLAAVQNANATIYTFGSTDTRTDRHEFVKMATATGGASYGTPESALDLINVIENVIEKASTDLTLNFTVVESSKKSDIDFPTKVIKSLSPTSISGVNPDGSLFTFYATFSAEALYDAGLPAGTYVCYCGIEIKTDTDALIAAYSLTVTVILR